MKTFIFIKKIFSKSFRKKIFASISHNKDEIVQIDGRNIKVGKYTFGVGNIKLAHHTGSPILEIGRFCSIAGNVTIFTGAYHRTDWLTTYPFGHIHEDKFGNNKKIGYPFSKGAVIIKNDVWIGNSATIMSGVTINDGAVIAANSHVIKDVLPYEIVGGNPAKHIKFRFEQEVIDLMLELKWWELDEREIIKIKDVLLEKPNIKKLKQILNK